MKNLFELLKRVSENTPNKEAIITENKTYSYQEYYENALYIANFLQDKIQGNHPTIVLVDDSEYDLFAFMAVLSLGKIYVPVNVNLSQDKIMERIESIDASLILSTVDVDFVESINVKKLFDEEDGIKDKLSAAGLPNQRVDAAFGIYTSGSTGKPKLVIKSHASILSMCEVFTETFGFKEEDIFANQIAFEFDGSLKSIYLSLYNSASMVLIKAKHFSTPKKVIDLIIESKANILIWSTFALRVFQSFKVFKYKKLENIDRVMFSGEAIPRKTIEYWQENLDTSYVNLYAPTEVSFNCTYHEIKKDDNYDKIPIGKPFKKNQILIVDENLKEEETGKAGEILVSGVALAMGYYNDEELTKQKFIHLSTADDKNTIFYRTGDYGYLDNDGNYYIMGRKDNQIKRYGYRIELEEIDLAIQNIGGVSLATSVYDYSNQAIFAMVEAEITEAELMAQLKEKLPKYMMPRRVFVVDKMPLTANGKIDRKQIKKEIMER